MGERRQPREPSSIEEANARKREVEQEIWSIERQLAEGTKVDPRTGKELTQKEYRNWRGRTHTSLMYKKTEQAFLKDWIKNRRRVIEANAVGIFNPNDPRELLVRAHAEIKKVLAGGDEDKLGEVYNVIDQYLNHAA